MIDEEKIIDELLVNLRKGHRNAGESLYEWETHDIVKGTMESLRKLAVLKELRAAPDFEIIIFKRVHTNIDYLEKVLLIPYLAEMGAWELLEKIANSELEDYRITPEDYVGVYTVDDEEGELTELKEAATKALKLKAGTVRILR